MSYVVLARKWRPQSFQDLVGQEHVSTTIANAITQNRVAHAFLFTGVRGVGKTTSARILAKALNCEKGPTPTPCQTCPACLEITNGSDVDVQEIDGASYTGVDDVRKLQESLPYRPQRDRFKIFIVDEVHMLSVNAWNAFLKTLEEPPPHVKFIFATTEVHKVPVTILSRCQRYDFKLIGAQTIAARLKWVLGEEKIGAEDAAVATIAREAAGSMRDAMSLLDQVIAWVGTSGDRLTAEGVARVLGVADRQVLHRLAGALVAGDPAECVRIVGELAGEGYDIPHVAKNILAQLRDLAVAKVCASPEKLLDLAEEEIADVKALAARAEADDLVRLHQGFSKAFDDIVRGGQPRASLEMALIRLARRPPLVPIEDLLLRLADLERRLGGGGGGGGGGAPSGGGAGASRGGGRPGAGPGGPGYGPRASAEAPRAAETPAFAAPAPQAPAPVAREVAAAKEEPVSPKAEPVSPKEEPVSPKAEPVSPKEEPVSPKAEPVPQATDETVPKRLVEPAQEAASPVVVPARPAFEPPARPNFEARPGAPPPARPNFEAPARPNFDGPPPSGPRFAPPPGVMARQGSNPPPPMESGPPSNRPGSPQKQGESVLGRPVAAPPTRPATDAEVTTWRKILDDVRKRRPALASVLSHAQIFDMTPERVTLGYDQTSFLYAQATENAAKDLLTQVVRAFFRAETEVVLEIAVGRTGTTIAELDTKERNAKREAARREVAEHPLVVAAIRTLGAELIDVRLVEAAEA